MKCTLCGWDVLDPCVTKGGERHKPRGCGRLVVDRGRAYQVLPGIDPETDSSRMERFEIPEETSKKFNLT